MKEREFKTDNGIVKLVQNNVDNDPWCDVYFGGEYLGNVPVSLDVDEDDYIEEQIDEIMDNVKDFVEEVKLSMSDEEKKLIKAVFFDEFVTWDSSNQEKLWNKYGDEIISDIEDNAGTYWTDVDVSIAVERVLTKYLLPDE